jgi:nitroimidazol reductase NimA-like FMN-containing flavoprotein (pyridoxamine 5'-phosphate oxidase superfamily)
MSTQESLESSDYDETPRTTFKRLAYRGTHDRAVVHAILDEALVCHVAFTHGGQPALIPTAYARQGDRLLLHGSSGNRMLRALADGGDICICVTLLDGIVFARSAFHHSVNYRSVVVYGRAHEIADLNEKREALRVIVEHVAPGRSEVIRPPTDAEVVMTKVIAVPIVEASAKVRTGPPIDDEPDYALPVWAGVLPSTLTFGTPEPCERLHSGIEAPAHVRSYRRPGR